MSAQVKAALDVIETMTLQPEHLGRLQIDAAREAGVSDEALADATTVCALFNVINRLADAFHFHVPPRAAMDAHAPTMVKRGYALPAPLRVRPAQ